MGRSDYYHSGDWNAICDVCGQKWKASKIKRRWDNLMVCPKDWEPRHPQEFVRGITENLKVPFNRPESTDSFVVDYCGMQGVVGIGVVGFMVVGSQTLPDLSVCGINITTPPTFTDPTVSGVVGVGVIGKMIIGNII